MHGHYLLFTKSFKFNIVDAHYYAIITAACSAH